MLYDIERLAYLSGVSSHDDYHDSLDERYPRKNKGQKLLSESSKIRGKNTRKELQEVRLRKMIRAELKSVLAEMETEKAEKAISNAKKTKSVGVSMGFPGVGFGSRQTSSKNVERRKPGTQRGFFGPGFF
jgi:hypothetical protein